MAASTDQGRRSEIVSLRFTPQQIRWIEEAAEADGISTSSLIRRAVGAYLLGEWDEGAYRPRPEEVPS